MNEFGIRLKNARIAAGLSQLQLASMSGVPQSSLTGYETGRIKSSKDAIALARALNVDPGWLISGEVEGKPSPRGKHIELNAPPSRGAWQPTPGMVQPVGENDFPVMGIAEGGDGRIILLNDVIEWIKRPGPLVGVPSSFAIYVVGDSMEPVYRHGDYLLIHPSRPPSQRDNVVVVYKDGDDHHYALVKTLIRITDDKVYLRQYNPPCDLDPIDRRLVEKIYLIVGSYSSRR